MTRDYDPFTNGYLLNANLPISHKSESNFTVEKIHSEISEQVWWKRLQASYWLKFVLFSPFTLFEMDSSSDSGPTVEDKIVSLETSLERLWAYLDQQENLLKESNQAGEKAWDLINNELRKLRADHDSSKENLENFKEEAQANFKDVANVHGNFGNQISSLESAMANLKANLGKWNEV